MISSFRFASSSHASVFFFFKCINVGRTILSLYVDDMIIIGDDIDVILFLKTELARQFEIKDLSSLQYFPSIEVTYLARSYLLSQSKCVANILERARIINNKIIDTLIELNSKYSFSDDLPLSDPTLSRTIVGSLIYLTITYPKITYVIHVVSQFIASPIIVYWVQSFRTFYFHPPLS